MRLLDGKAVSRALCEQIAEHVNRLKSAHGVCPGLAVVLVGEDPASQVYVGMKVKMSAELGIHSRKCVLRADATHQEVLAVVRELNQNREIHGILVQSPPPPHIDERAIIETLDPTKDVDCFHPYNVGRMLIGDEDGFLPCTPHGIMVLMQRCGVQTYGKHAVVLGRSNIVGKPMAALLQQKRAGANATVTVCHSRTENLKGLCAQADILIAALGRAEFVTADMVKEGATVVDVGINRVDDPGAKRGYRLVGDVAFDEVSRKAEFITPVPGGVGPMTISMLMYNTLKACCLQEGLELPDFL